MTQEVFDKLVEDGIEIGWGIDQHEVIAFLENIADKYNLRFNQQEYLIDIQ